MSAHSETVTKRVIDVLVVDDSPVDRLFYRRLLSGGDGQWYVVDVATPMEAIALCQQAEVRCVLTDYLFPTTTGIDLIEELRTLPVEPAIPAVIITGGAEPSVIARALDAGASAVLGKGLVNVRALRGAVEQAMSGSRAAREEVLRAEFAYACVSTTGTEREPGAGELERFAVVAELSRLIKVLRTRR